MNLRTSEIDMLHGSLTKKILLFTLPIALSSMIQQLFNAADTAVVGYFCDSSALAAVGTNTEIIALIVTLSSGLSVGVNVLVASYIGRGDTNNIPSAVRTAVLLSAFLGIVGALLGQTAVNPLLRLIHTPENIFNSAEMYLRIYLSGYPFLLVYDFCSAVMRAKGDSRFPFFALTISGIVNVLLNLFFVVVFDMGVPGVALATAISNALSALIVIIRLKKEKLFRFGIKRSELPFSVIGDILKTGIPSAVQGAVFCLANIFVQASVNTFGETAIAGSTIAMNFEYFTYYIITAFGQTATTFICQNFTAKKYDRCRTVLRQCLLLSFVLSGVPIFLIVIFHTGLSGLFTKDAAVVESAGIRIMCILLFEPICNFYEIPAGVLRGCGHAVFPAIGTIIGTCAFRIIWICTVFSCNPTLPILYHAFPLSWAATIIIVNVGGIAVLRLNRRRMSDKQSAIKN
jgi:putative MATE family efflux protein